MAFFKCFKKGTITILEDPEDAQSDGTTLQVHPSLTGPQAIDVPPYDPSAHILQWTHVVPRQLAMFRQPRSGRDQQNSHVLLLKSSHHDQNTPQTPFKLLSDRVRNGSVKWSNAFRANGGFSYTEFYWEWVEDILSRNGKLTRETGLYRAIFASLFSYDRFAPVIRAFCEYWCPVTNTLHTSSGEMSISLWDLDQLGGLPIAGRFYDEVVLTAEELSATSKGSQQSCRYLFLAYHKLCKESQGQKVKITSWIRYWYRGALRYKRPPNKSTRNKRDPPPNVFNPSGRIHEIRQRTSADLAVFEDLGVEGEDIEPTYLAAFLACWLCLFVLPGDNTGLIRPGVFKVASKMSQGVQFCLAVPVLASIYQGLNEISVSSDPGNCSAALPFHYIYAWLAEYFGTHFQSPLPNDLRPRMVRFSGELSARHFGDSQALSLFDTCDNVKMGVFARVFSESRVIINRSNISHLDLIYLISLRSGYLSLRQDNRRVVQPYSPHRFSRQFGYVQDIPGSLKNDIRTGVLALIYLHWDSCTRMDTNCEVTLPIQSAITEYMVTRDYVNWWSKVYHSTPVKTTRVAPTSRALHKPLKAKEDKDVNRAAPRRQNVIACEVECSTNVPVLPDRASLPDKDHQAHPVDILEDDGDSLDSHAAFIRPLKLKRPVIKERRRSGSSGSNDSEVHFKRRKTDTGLGPIYCDPNAEFTMNTDFLCDISTSSQPMLQQNEGAEIDGHSLWGNDDASLDPIRVPSAAELEAYALPTKGKSNAKNDSQQIDPTGPLTMVHPPKPLNTIAFSEASLGGAAIIDASQRLRDIRQQAATAVCEQIEDMIMKHSSKTILSSKGELDKLIAELSHYGIDPSSVRGKVEGLLNSADQYNLARLSCSRKATPGTRIQRLADTKSEIAKATSIHQADSDHRQSALKSLEKLKEEQRKLEQTVTLLDERLLLQEKKLVDLKKEETQIQETPEVTTAELETTKSLRDTFENHRNSFKGLTWV
ncbi:uncharacterized protein LOC121051359 [Rosa chinensis]|uniref:uncharacterized protein LOC121051359 n=1 Tax=Rosa chinensis TaxID=74649 RepID=UPI001AD8C330|nr:uncharacterized protein LOC121051359 [Rosa chinensis]